MAFGKWIGGYLGWSAFGPLGGLIGFVVGALFDTATSQGEGETLRLNQEQSQQGDRNSFFISMLVLAAYIVKADGKVMHSEMELVRGMVSPDSLVSRDPFMFYVKTGSAAELYSFLIRETDAAHLAVFRDSRKVYCLPRSLNKGAAARRYQIRSGHEGYIAAGDSEFDIPMLRAADICLCPEGLPDFVPAGKRIVCSGVFSDTICDRLTELRETLSGGRSAFFQRNNT